MEELRRREKILRKLVKAEVAMKRKYNSIKRSKANIEMALGETFKPIIDPLEKLVTLTEKRKINNKRILVKNDFQKEYESADNISLDKSYDTEESLDDTLQNTLEAHETSFETAGSEVEEEKEEEDFPTYQYILMLNQGENVDKIYGVRKDDNGFTIGDSPIYFEDKLVKVKNMGYAKTRGLMELLISKHPNTKLVNSNDLQNYRSILETTSAHKRRYRTDESIRASNSKKFNTIISPLFSKTPKKVGKGLPRYKIARRDTRMDYVYWDDPNELVDRLRLLMAEQSAGNPSHINEIHSIIEELREGGYIY